MARSVFYADENNGIILDGLKRVDKNSTLLYNNSTKKKKKPEGLPPEEERTWRRDCEKDGSQV